MKNCKEIREKLSPFIDNELSPAERGLIEKHIQQCSACQQEEKSLRQIGILLGSMPGPDTSPVFASQAVHRAANWKRCAFVKERLWKPAVAFALETLSFIFGPEQTYAPANRYLHNFDDFPPESLSSVYVTLIQGESR